MHTLADLDPVAAGVHLPHQARHRVFPVDQQDPPLRVDDPVQPGGGRAPDADDEELRRRHHQQRPDVLEMLGQQRDQQVGHEVRADAGERLGVDQVPGAQVAHPEPSVDDVEDDQQQPVHRHHEPVAGTVVRDLHVLVVVIHPHIPVRDDLRGEDHHAEQAAHDPLVLFT